MVQVSSQVSTVGFTTLRVALGQAPIEDLPLSFVIIITSLVYIHSCIIRRIKNGPVSCRDAIVMVSLLYNNSSNSAENVS